MAIVPFREDLKTVPHHYWDVIGYCLMGTSSFYPQALGLKTSLY